MCTRAVTLLFLTAIFRVSCIIVGSCVRINLVTWLWCEGSGTCAKVLLGWESQNPQGGSGRGEVCNGAACLGLCSTPK